VQDISAHKRNEATVHRLAYYDELTGLPNRAQFRSHLESACQLAQHGHQQMALMFVDLDRFKNVNDTLGHAVGDGLLRRVARRLRSALRDSDVVARLGGDEFTVLLQNLRRPQDATHVAEQLLAELARPCEIHGHRVHTAGSIGITLCPQDGSDPDTLLRQADMAMYAAKRAGRNTMTYFTPALTERAQRYLQLEGLLRRRLAENTLEVYYQPVVNLASGAITGCECLLRCRDYRDELLNTEELVKVADEAGLSEQLFEHILRKVTAAARHWHDSDGNPLPINVNVASSQLRGALEQSTLLTQLETTQFDLSRLVLELTESAFIGPSPELPEWLRTLRQRGVRVALDDFGTGYSALGYLRRFPVDILKIDRSFVVDMIEDPTHEALVSAILAMANSLSLKVVAEGVETFSQAQRLQELGCHFGQGYLWSPGLPAKAFSELLATSTAVRHSYQN
jgi:diguanylate cyclase (GGDEF)-like protein